MEAPCSLFPVEKKLNSDSLLQGHSDRRNTIPLPGVMVSHSLTELLKHAFLSLLLRAIPGERAYCGFGLGCSRSPSGKFSGSSRWVLPKLS